MNPSVFYNSSSNIVIYTYVNVDCLLRIKFRIYHILSIFIDYRYMTICIFEFSAETNFHVFTMIIVNTYN